MLAAAIALASLPLMIAKETIVVRLTPIPVSDEILKVLPGAMSNTVPIWTSDAGDRNRISAEGQEDATLTFMSSLPTRNYTLPKVKRLSQIFILTLSAGLEHFAAVLGSAQEGQFDRLWIDMDRNRVFGENEELPSKPMSIGNDKYRCFGPVDVPRGPWRPESIYALLSPEIHDIAAPNGFLTIQSRSAMAGELALGSNKIKLMLVDSNLDGAFDPWSGGDSMLLDTNGNGQFDQSGPMALLQGRSTAEAIFLKDFVQLPNGGFYEVETSADSSTLTLTRDVTTYGRITGFKPGSFLSARLRGISAGFVAEDGSISVPPGEIEIRQAVYSVADDKGRLYTFESSGEMLFPVKVESGKSEAVPNGLPLKIDMKVEKNDEGYVFFVNLKDKFDRVVREVFDPAGTKISDGRLTIRDANGKLLHETSEGFAMWEIPKGAKGPFTASVSLDLGPLGRLTAKQILSP